MIVRRSQLPDVLSPQPPLPESGAPGVPGNPNGLRKKNLATRFRLYCGSTLPRLAPSRQVTYTRKTTI